MVESGQVCVLICAISRIAKFPQPHSHELVYIIYVGYTCHCLPITSIDNG
jgi:hypothetical protein